ncbi:glycosyltransferase [uncultured Rikenella sp.]|uniref:glycosyltransferase n=1 Tax=uncultured Rikenella sp. TaxID=368003 RepID=UPI00262AAD28|nr:glycosyltransferase [uncultured Rikenella sp.]
MKTVVVSAVNIVSGGTLTILRQCLGLLSVLGHRMGLRIIAVVHARELADFPHIEYIEWPHIKESWLKRIWCEYVGFHKLSQQLAPVDLWLSLHDMTPRVQAFTRAVYCHNPTPFYKTRWRDMLLDYKVFLFSIFYKHLYQINIKKNNYIIVQQDWLRNAFADMYRLDKKKIIVAYPNTPRKEQEINEHNEIDIHHHRPIRFFYPALPRIFKNFEVICQAAQILEHRGIQDFIVSLTIDGTENSYAKKIVNTYKHCTSIRFVGLITSEKMGDAYLATDCLIFPSKLETWGLPLSEFSSYDRPILAANLPYAHEASNGAKLIDFFDPSSPEELADKMAKFISNDLSNFGVNKSRQIKEPFTTNWETLILHLLSSK